MPLPQRELVGRANVLGVAIPTWRQRLHASDPGAVRLALALRAVVHLAVVLAVNDLIATGLGLTGTPRMIVLILGAVLAMIATFTMSEPTVAGRVVTLACLPVAMLATITLATLVDRHRILSLATYVAIMVLAVWARRFGPRAFACGMVAWIGYFIALFLQLSLAMLPVVALAVAAAAAVMLVLSTVLVPMSPRRRLRRMVDALDARVAIARHDAQRGRHGDDGHDLAVALLRVNEVAMLVDGQLAVPGAVRDPADAGRSRAAVLRVEHALAAVLEGATDDDALDAALEHLRAVAAGERTARGPVAGPFTPGVELFAGFLPGSVATVGAMVDDRPGLSLNTRQIVQITVAGSLTIVLGDLLSGQRWYWAVLACFLAFTGTATAAETARKAGQRAVGTVVGVVIAMPLLPLLGHALVTGLVTMLVALFVGFYFFRVSYTVLAVAVTVLVGELYELMGSFSDDLLWLRVTETAVGAAVGAVVAVCVLPTASRDAETAARARLAEDLRDALDAMAATIRGEAADLHERLRVLDAGLHQLTVIGVPMLRREVPGTRVPRAHVRGRLRAWVTCAVRVRALVHAIEDAPGGRVPGHPQVARTITAARGLTDDVLHGGSGDRVRELAALEGALLALHEIDGHRLVGAAPPDVTVTLIDVNGRERGHTRAADGHYELVVPASGAWQLVAGAPGHSPRVDRIVVDDTSRVVVHDLTMRSHAPR